MQHFDRSRRPRLTVILGVVGLALVVALGSALVLHRRGGGPAPGAGRGSIATRGLQPPAALGTSTAERAAAAAASAARNASGQPSASTGGAARLVIAKIGVNAPVDSVGLDSSGAMDVPRGWDDVGWFTGGSIPGQPGLALIDGHLDSTTGPAVFWHLAQLHPGDQIVVISDSGKRTTFRVNGSGSVPAGNSDWSAGVFQRSGPARLILVTCGGTWDRAAHQYRQRLVIDATVVS